MTLTATAGDVSTTVDVKTRRIGDDVFRRRFFLQDGVICSWLPVPSSVGLFLLSLAPTPTS